jgi:GNAT superfamily N-acetyltransferase
MTTIRQATPADAGAIDRIRVDAWQVAYRDILPADYLASLEKKSNPGPLEKRLGEQGDEFSVWVAEIDGAPRGFAVIGKPRYDTADNTVELRALNVLPTAWGKGLGAALIDHVQDRVEVTGAARVELWCIEENHRARELYERCGFDCDGRKRESSGLTGHPLREVCYVRYTMTHA